MHSSRGGQYSNEFDSFSQVVGDEEQFGSAVFVAGDMRRYSQRMSAHERSELASTVYPQAYSVRGTDVF